MTKIKVENCIETTYEDGSYWIVYMVGDKEGYEIYEPQNKEEQDLEYLTSTANLPENISQYTNKPSINVCSNMLKELILDCLHSDNEMWYCDQDLLEDFYEIEDIPSLLDELEEEVKNLGLSNHVIFNQDDTPIIVYGGVITKFLFNN